MPHFQIDYSANIEEILDVSALCEKIRATAATIDTFPMAGIRVRATCVTHYAIADGDPKHGFIDLSVRLRAGRPTDVKRAAIAQIFATLQEFTAPAMATHSIAISAEMRDIDPDLSPKFGTIRSHLKDTS
jgi:5-carboxymethyl-2-hydroxymuconate isomerase